MLTKARAAAHLLAGDFTPFLSVRLSIEAKQRAERWLRGSRDGAAVPEFEERAASFLGRQYRAQAFGSGRAALFAALRLFDLPSRSEVVIPSFCCRSVVEAVMRADLAPVFADCDEDFNLRMDSVKEVYSPRVRAIVLPHLSGCWTQDTERILDWARARRIWVVEDVCQALGLSWRGRSAGSFGDVAIASIGIGKNVFGPGGGFLATADSVIKERMARASWPAASETAVAARLKRYLRYYCCSRRVASLRLLGDSLRLRLGLGPGSDSGWAVELCSDIEAWFGVHHMSALGASTTARRMNAGRWAALFREHGLARIRMLSTESNIWTKCLLRIEDDPEGAAARALRRILWSAGVEPERSYTPLHLAPSFERTRRGSTDIVMRLWRSAFCVPVRPTLDSSDWQRIRHAVERASREPALQSVGDSRLFTRPEPRQ